MRELKYVYIVEFWREHWKHTEYDYIGVFRKRSRALQAKEQYLQEHDGADTKEVTIRKRELI